MHHAARLEELLALIVESAGVNDVGAVELVVVVAAVARSHGLPSSRCCCRDVGALAEPAGVWPGDGERAGAVALDEVRC